MNLVIDIGNSRIKTAVFEQGKIARSSILGRNEFVPRLRELHSDFPQAKDVLVSHVGKMEESWGKFLKENFRMWEFSPALPLPFKNLYKSPATLGLDRIGSVAAAFQRFPDQNVLIIDAGTCVTYDFLNRKGEYLGGAISPGIQMRYKALHTFTENLPLLALTEKAGYLGGNTVESIKTGVITGISLEIDGFIALYRGNFEDLTVILTGGDNHLLSNTIKNSIFAPSNFLLEGLNAILEFNKNQ